MTIYIVDTANDLVSGSDGRLSLREAVNAANATAAADTIVFAPGVEGAALVLTGGELTLSRDTMIDGDQNNAGLRTTLSGGDASRVLVTSGDQTDVTLTELVLRDGRGPQVDFVEGSGGAVFASGRSLTIDNAVFLDNSTSASGDAFGSGGAIFSVGGLISITDSMFTNNSAYHARPGAFTSGGAICIDGGELLIENSQFFENSANFGGAIATGYGGATKITIRTTDLSENYSGGGGALSVNRTSLVIEDSNVSDNQAYYPTGAQGGGLSIYNSDATIMRSSINNNQADSFGAGIVWSNSIDDNGNFLTIADSTIAGNSLADSAGMGGGGIVAANGSLSIRNTTITGNIATEPSSRGGGILAFENTSVELANDIIAGNLAEGGAAGGYDVFSYQPVRSNGHNIFGSDVLGAVAGDRENIAGSTLFAQIDPASGAGLANADGVVPLEANLANPALGGADRLAIGSPDQLGTSRPAPTGTNPDAGAAESAFAVSTVASANNDTLTGTAAADTLGGQAGHDFLKGLGGNDTINGGAGGDFLEGNAGNDKLNGGSGIDVANYGDRDTRVTIDLRGDGASDKDTARRGSETDTLTGIEGAIAGDGNDRFFGDNSPNWFQGGKGKDTFTGGGGRDLYDYNLTTASPASGGRDVITDFVHLTDDIDLMGIDADTTVAGNQAFRWVGTAALAGPGEVGFFTANGNTIIRMSTDADAASEGEIQLTGIKTPNELDFYL